MEKMERKIYRDEVVITPTVKVIDKEEFNGQTEITGIVDSQQRHKYRLRCLLGR